MARPDKGLRRRWVACLFCFLALSTASWVAVPTAVDAQPGCTYSEWSGRWFEQFQECVFLMTDHNCFGIRIRCPPAN